MYHSYNEIRWAILTIILHSRVAMVPTSESLLWKLEKGALTPKSFANIVQLNLNLNFIFQNKLVSKDPSVWKQKNEIMKDNHESWGFETIST